MGHKMTDSLRTHGNTVMRLRQCSTHSLKSIDASACSSHACKHAACGRSHIRVQLSANLAARLEDALPLLLGPELYSGINKPVCMAGGE